MLRVWLCVGVLGGIIGCAGTEAGNPLPDTTTATGFVTLDGAPLANAAITFIPSGVTQGIECYGATGENGEFEMKQLRGEEGAPPGNYKVIVSRFVKPDGSPFIPGPNEAPANVGATESLPARYSTPNSTVLTAVVPATGGDFKFDLKSR